MYWTGKPLSRDVQLSQFGGGQGAFMPVLSLWSKVFHRGGLRRCPARHTHDLQLLDT
jgi:hypothetical protein